MRHDDIKCDLFLSAFMLFRVGMCAYACSVFVYVLITYVCVGGFRVKEAFYQQAPAAVAALSG